MCFGLLPRSVRPPGRLALIFPAARVSGKMRRANGHRREAPMDFLAVAQRFAAAFRADGADRGAVRGSRAALRKRAASGVEPLALHAGATPRRRWLGIASFQQRSQWRSLAGAFLMGHGAVAEKLYRVIHRIPLPRLRSWIEEKERAFLDTDQHSTELFRARKRQLAKCAVLFLAAWLAESLDSWISLRLLGVRVSYANVLSFDSLVSLIRSLAFFLPGALVAPDLTYIAFLRTFGIAD